MRWGGCDMPRPSSSNEVVHKWARTGLHFAPVVLLLLYIPFICICVANNVAVPWQMWLFGGSLVMLLGHAQWRCSRIVQAGGGTVEVAATSRSGHLRMTESGDDSAA
jgi:hypothetical protein